MDFKLSKPCANCPFRVDRPFYLRPERRDEIADALLADGTFPCHKTVDYAAWEHDAQEAGEEEMDVEYVHQGGEQFCAGALITMIKNDHEWTANAYLRIAQRFGGFDPEHDFDLTAPTFDSLDAFREGPDC